MLRQKRNMTLNKMIKSNAKRENKMLIGRFDKNQLTKLKIKMQTEPLTIYEFTTLADIYDVEYKFVVTINHKNGYAISTYCKDDYFYGCMDGIINEYIKERDIDSSNMTLHELQEYLERHDSKIEVKEY